MAKLLILTGKHQGKRLTLPDRDVIVGRSEECNITLKTDEVSRQHCRLSVIEGQLTVCDLGSRNGTVVNGVEAVGDVPLNDGDELQIGPMRFRVQTSPPADAKPSSNSLAVNAPASGQLDEDSIASWLSENSDDTHTIKAAADDDTAIHPVVGPSSRKTFASVADEAQDIIKRHLQLKSGSGST
ncbi:FHA domain-containing protein [bacterium]|nr:FHA domain-containing protein [bacterium]